jgi:uncharacterized membrane protein
VLTGVFSKIRKPTNLYIMSFMVLLIIGVVLRLVIFDQVGGDHNEYKRAVLSFTEGENPYIYTVESFDDPEKDHGYAYFPTLLYIQSILWVFNITVEIDTPTAVLWKIPTLIADIGIALILFKYFFRKSIVGGLLAVFIWLFNPYFVIRYQYTLYDPLQVFFLLLGLFYLGKKDFLSGIFYALSLSIKITPLILLPIILFKARERTKLLLAIVLVFFLISIPFLTSLADLSYYLNGTLFVHGSRDIQGRPFLTFLSYYLQNINITFLQERYTSFYSLLALVAGPLITTYLIIKKKYTNTYALIGITYLMYYLFTPVLARTHILWGLPFIVVGLYEYFKEKKYIFYSLSVLLYLLLSSYLFLWYKGFKAPDEYNSKIWMDDLDSIEYSFPIKDVLYEELIMFKRSL